MQTLTQRITVDSFVGERTDVPYPKLSPSYLTLCQNGVMYRGAIQRVGGYSKFLADMTGSGALSGAIQAIFRVPLNDGTIRLVIATENKLYALNSGATAFTDISNSNGLSASAWTVTQIANYGGTKDALWSGCSFNFSSTVDCFVFTNYNYSPPQAWNGKLTADGTKVIVSAVYGTNYVTIEVTGHGYATGQVVELYHIASTTSINKCYQIIVTDANHFKVQVFGDPTITSVTSATANITHKVGNAWVYSNGFRAKVVRNFENHLSYYGIFDGTTAQPYTLFHTNIADPTDVTAGDAGFVAKPEGGDAIVTAEQISIYNAVYKKSSILLETYTGDDLKFSYVYQVNNLGAFSAKSVINKGSEHIFPAQNKDGLFDGFYNFSGQSAEVISSSLGIRDKVRNSLNSKYPELFIGAYLSIQDFYIWVYPSTSSSTYQDTAIVWNRNDDVWFFWKLNKSASSFITSLIEFERVSSTTMAGLGTWHSGTWIMGTLPYAMGSSAYNGIERLLLLGDSAGQAYTMDNSVTFDGTAIGCKIERQDFPIDNDMRTIKYINKISLRFAPNATNSVIDFYFGYRLKTGSQIFLLPAQRITLSGSVTDFDLNLFQTDGTTPAGRLFSWSIRNQDSTQPFELQQMIIDYTVGGTE